MSDSVLRITDLGQGRKRFERILVAMYNVYKSGADQIVAAGPAIVEIDTERNAVSGLTLVSNQIKIADADFSGKYEINAHVSGIGTNSNSKSNYEIFLAKNGTEIPGARGKIHLSKTSDGNGVSIFVEDDLVLNDTIDIRVVRVNGGADMAISSDLVSIRLRKMG